jgi:cytochrome c556
MKRFLIPAVIIASAVASSSVFADPAGYGKTRAQVRSELVQARQAGELDAPDTTYPAAQLRAAAALQSANTSAPNVPNTVASAVGGAVTGHSESGRRTVSAPEARDSIYFGQ